LTAGVQLLEEYRKEQFDCGWLRNCYRRTMGWVLSKYFPQTTSLL